MEALNVDKFLQITEKIRVKSNGDVSYKNNNEPSLGDFMDTGRFCRIYGLFIDGIWCYDQALVLVNSLRIPIEGKHKMKSFILSTKAMCLSTMGHNDEAISVCERALQLYPENFEAYCNKGIALDHIGKYRESVKAHQEAIKIKPDFANSWNAIGYILVDYEKDYERAIPYLDKALELSDGKDTHAWINKGNALAQLGKLEEAFLCWETAYEIEPEKNVHAMLNKAIWLFKDQSKKNETLNLLNQVREEISIDNPYFNQVTQLYERIYNDY